MKDELFRLVPRFPEMGLVYLFGSRVGGRLGPHSDYDLAVLPERGRLSPARRALLEHELGRLLGGSRLDLVWLDKAPVELAYVVISQGKVLYERDVATRVEYEALVMSRYGDYLPVLRKQRADIIAGGKFDRRVQWYREALGRTERTLGEIRTAQRTAQT